MTAIYVTNRAGTMKSHTLLFINNNIKNFPCLRQGGMFLECLLHRLNHSWARPEETKMLIAITSQNFRTVTGHAGKARRFIIYEVDAGGQVAEKERLDLPREMAMHEFNDRQPHPLDGSDVLITAGSGDGFVRRMARRGTRVVATSETDPEIAVHAFLAGCLKQPAPHEHNHEHHHDHGHAEGHACGCAH